MFSLSREEDDSLPLLRPQLFTETDFDGHVSQVSLTPNPQPPSNSLTSRHCRRERRGSGEGCLTQPQPQVSTRQRPPPPEPLLESRSSSFKVPSWLSAAILRCHYVNSKNLCDECPGPSRRRPQGSSCIE